ncbi:MAG: hypothetical protein K0S43_2240 [Cellulosimicrobium sp.]|nr:hypothetical protein [Cellulosimicrobium sp.]
MGVPLGGRGPSRPAATLPSVSRGCCGRARTTAVGLVRTGGRVRRGAARGRRRVVSDSRDSDNRRRARRRGAAMRDARSSRSFLAPPGRSRRGCPTVRACGRRVCTEAIGPRPDPATPSTRRSSDVRTRRRGERRRGRDGDGRLADPAGRPWGVRAVARQVRYGAGDGNRTRVASLEDWGSTIELRPRGSWTEIPAPRPEGRGPACRRPAAATLANVGGRDRRTPGRRPLRRPGRPSTASTLALARRRGG